MSMKKPRLSTILLILWGLTLSGAVAMYLTYLQPARLGKTVSEALESSLGIPSSIRKVDFYLFPSPSVRIYGLRFEYAGDASLEFRADSCSAQLSWLSLIRLKPLLDAVDLEGPVADALLPPPSLTAERPSRPLNLTLPDKMPALPPSLAGVSIRVHNGIFRLRQTDSTLNVLLSGISGSARLPGLMSGTMDLTVGSARLRVAKAPQISLDNFRLNVASLSEENDGGVTGALSVSALAQMASLEESLGRPIKPAYRYFPLPRPARLEAKLEFGLSPAGGGVSCSGLAKADLVLPMNGHDTPLSVSLPFALQDTDAIRINDMIVALYNDKATINGVLSGLAVRAPLFTGRAEVQSFSLTHWFGFSRKMTGGLQLGLDHISGLLDFRLTPTGLEVPSLEARVGDITLRGSGSCADFRKPVIVLDGETEYADLNPLFPEINGIKTPKPDLPPPAVPVGDDNDGNPPNVGFRIALRAARADIHRLRAGQAECVIEPLNDPHDPERLESGQALDENTGARLNVSVGDLYGGTATATADLESPYDLHVELRDVALEEPITSLAGFPAMGGTLQAVSDVTFSGSSPAEMISRLAGTVNATLSDGFFGTKTGRKTPYSAMAIVAQAKAEPGDIPLEYDLPPNMDFRGTWDVDLTMPALRARLNANSLIRFDLKKGLPESMPPQPADIRLVLNRQGLGMNHWPKNVDLALKGTVGFDLNQGIVSVADISGGRSGLALGGSLRAENIFENLRVQGPLSAKSAVLREITPLFGLTPPPMAKPTALTLLILQSDLVYTRNTLALNNITATLDDSSLSGGMTFTLGARPFWKADVRLDTVNGDDYWPGSDGGPPSPVPTDLLRRYDADLRFSVGRFSLFSTPMDTLILPLTLNKGHLSTGVFSASFPGGGSLSGAYQGEATAAPSGGAPGLLSNRLQLRLTDVNMLELTRSRKQDTLTSGNGMFQLDAQAGLRFWSDMPRAIDGNWSAEILNGYLVSAEAEREAARSPVNPMSGSGTASPAPSSRTLFQRIHASGNILAGVLHSGDFLLKGPGLTVTGKGDINLNSRTIAADATATFLGIPEIPMKISGDLANPTTNYGVMGAFAGTLHNLGGSVLNGLTNVITAPFRLLSGGK